MPRNARAFGAAAVLLAVVIFGYVLVRPAEKRPSVTPVSATGAALVIGQIVDADANGISGLRISSEGQAATSSDGGAFALGGLTLGRHRLEVRGAGFLPVAVDTEAPAAGIKIEVSRAVSIVGRVTLNGAPVADAEIEAAGRTVESDADGRFELSGLPEGRYVVTARREALAAVADGVERSGAGPFAEVGLALAPAASIAGRVTDEAGAGVADARVVVQAALEGASARRTKTGADGSFKLDGLPPGDQSLSVQALGFLPPARQGLVLEPGATAQATVTLRRGAAIAGRVVDSTGAGIGGAVIEIVSVDGKVVVSAAERARRAAWADGTALAGGRLLPLGELGILVGAIPYPPPPGAPPPVRTTHDEPAIAGLITLADGSFRVDAVPPGRLFVRATATGFARGESEPLEARSGAPASAAVLLRRGATVTIAVVDGGGNPVAGAQVRLAGAFGLTGADGRASFEHVAGRGTAIVDGAGRLHAEKPLSDPGEGTSLEDTVVLAEAPAPDPSAAGSIRLTVRDELTRGLITSFSAVARGAAGSELRKAGAKGELTLAPVPGGRWLVRIEARGFAVSEVPVDVAVGLETPVAVEMSVGAAVGGIVYDEHGEPVFGATVSCGAVSGKTARTGAFRLAGVPTGDVTIVASHPTAGRGEARLSLNAGDEVVTLALALAQ